MEREVTPHDGHTRRGCQGTRFLRAGDDGKLFQKLVLAGQLLIVTNVRFCEGNRELSFDVDGEVVAPDKHRDHRRSLASMRVIFDVPPSSSYSSFDNTVETVVHLHNEPLKRILVSFTRVIFALICSGSKGIKLGLNRVV